MQMKLVLMYNTNYHEFKSFDFWFSVYNRSGLYQFEAKWVLKKINSDIFGQVWTSSDHF